MSGGPDTPELSIIVPIYNVDPYLGVCLDSIAAQTFKDWEAVLIDDGSTDFSGIICDSYSRKDNRFRVNHQENAGVSTARNTGIDAASAPLLAFIDPDDFISEKYFELLIQEMQREVDEYAEWLRGPEGRAWVDLALQECRAMAAAFEADCAAGKYALSPSELEQLRRDGVLVKCHPIKSGGVTRD